MADLDAALDHQRAFAVGRRVARHHVANVGRQLGLGQVAAPVDARHVEIGLIGAAHPVGHAATSRSTTSLSGFLQIQRAEVTRLAAEVVFNLGQGGEAEIRQARHLADLDFVHARGRRAAAAARLAISRACPPRQVRRWPSPATSTVVLSGMPSSSATLAQVALPGWASWPWPATPACARALGRQCFGLFHVGGVVAAGAVDDGVFAGGGDHLEFLAEVAAYGAAVGGDCAVGQAEAVKILR